MSQHLRSTGGVQLETAAVVRSTVAVSESDGGVTYHTGLSFNDELSLCDEEFETAAGQVPAASRASRA